MIASIGAIDFIPNYGIEFYPFASIFVAAGFMTINYAIVRYRLMDINIAITRAGIFAFVYTLVLGLPFGIAGMMKELIHRKPQWSFVPMSLLALLATVGPFIYMRLQRKFEARLRAEEFRSHEALRRLSHNMLRFTNLDVLLNLIVHHLVKVLKLNFASVYIYDSRDEKFTLRGFWKMGEAVELPLEFSKDSSLVKDLYQRRYPIVTGEVKLFAPKGISPHIKNLLLTLAKLKANTVIPSFLRNELLAFLVLSDRRTNLDFTQEDLNLLMVLSNEAALAIENAQFHQRDKMKLVEKSRREALADMAPGASHQFNNRLAAISSSAELLLLKLENLKINSVKDENVKAILEDTKATLEMIDKEVYKGKEITQAILKRAKAKVDFQELDVPNLIKSVYRIVMVSHSRLGGKSYKEPGFKLTLVNKIPLIYASEALLQDCFYNLIDNACDVFQEKLKDNSDFQPVIEVVLKEEGRKVSIEIKDNGIGLTEENKRKLFTPYFTTKASSTKGTGLGLYVIRDFIEMHKGTIVCDSEYGKGTTFTIRLPIKGKNKQ